jgi:hypothetical protein
MKSIEPHDKALKIVYEMLEFPQRRTKALDTDKGRRTEVDGDVSQVWE